MCKIDFLGSGVCASGLEKHYVSFYPEGRMDLYAALMENTIPVTEKCVEIADSCNLCGKCDYQCYFVNEMRPARVMKALKDHVGAHVKSGGKVVRREEDALLAEMKKIVGADWASNDAAIRITYHHDLCPHVTFKMPEYVVMPDSKEEISAIIKLLNKNKVPYCVRGNGASSHGLVFSAGAVLDLNRMKTMDFDEKNWSVKVGPGIAAFDLQREARKRGYRVHTAEPAALVCANIMTSGLLSTFSTTYGISADNFIDAEFVGGDGSIFRLNDIAAPNLFSFRNALAEQEALAVCVSVSVKLHPVTADEGGVLVPCASLDAALDFARECATRHIGLAIGILGGEFISSFIAPTKKLAAEAKDVFAKKLGMPYLVLLIGDAYALRSVREMGHPLIDQRLFKTLFQGLPALTSAKWMDLLEELADDEPFSYLRLEQFAELAETAIAPSPALQARDIDPDLRPFFEEALLPAGDGRSGLAEYVQDTELALLPGKTLRGVRLLSSDRQRADRRDPGRAAGRRREAPPEGRIRVHYADSTTASAASGNTIIYFDHNDPSEIARVQQATQEAGALLDDYCRKTGTIRQVRYVVNQGCCRKENLLYSPETI